jgi:hypothetical protein
VPVAEIEIENDTVVFVHEREQTRLFAGVRDVDRVAVLGENTADGSRNCLVVVSDQNTNETILLRIPLPSEGRRSRNVRRNNLIERVTEFFAGSAAMFRADPSIESGAQARHHR